MVQVSYQAPAELSEVEKYLLLMIRNTSGIKLSVLLAHFHYPTSFLKKVLDLLESKGLVSIDHATKVVFYTDILDLDEFSQDGLFSRFSINTPVTLSCPPKFYHRMMKVLDYLYQHSLDLYMLNYNMDAIENIKEILAILQNDFLSNFHELFYDLDEEFFTIFERNQRYFNDDNASFLIDFSLNVIYKIIHNIHKIVENEEIKTGIQSKYKDCYDRQQEAINNLVHFLSEFRSITRDKLLQGMPEASIISAYFILYFHKKIGPIVYYETENNFDDEFKSQIKKLMDVVNPKPFLYTIQSTTTWSIQFEIDSPMARGHKEYLQLTIVLSRLDASIVNKISQIVTGLIDKIKHVKDIYKIFYIEDIHDSEGVNAGQDPVILLKNDFLCNFRVLNRFICQHNRK
nr:hypothetical protein [Candidatus Sigynarchaeum springense]